CMTDLLSDRVVGLELRPQTLTARDESHHRARFACTARWLVSAQPAYRQNQLSLGALNFGLVVRRQSESEHGAMRLVRVGPQASAMGFDDGAADRKADPDAGGLRREEGPEDPLAILGGDTGPRVSNRNEQPLRARCGADGKLARALIEASHGLDRVHDQIQHDLLQLNPISVNGGQPLREPRMNCYVIVQELAAHERNHFFDGLAQIDAP